MSRILVLNSSKIWSPLFPSSLPLVLGQILRAFGTLVCPRDFPLLFAGLDLLERGDYVLEHLNPIELPRASRSWVFSFLAQVASTSRDLKFLLIPWSFWRDLLGKALEWHQDSLCKFMWRLEKIWKSYEIFSFERVDSAASPDSPVGAQFNHRIVRCTGQSGREH